MKRLLAIPALLFAFAANAENAWFSEWFKEYEEKAQEEADRIFREYCDLPDRPHELGICPRPPEEDEEEEEGEEEVNQ